MHSKLTDSADAGFGRERSQRQRRTYAHARAALAADRYPPLPESERTLTRNLINKIKIKTLQKELQYLQNFM